MIEPREVMPVLKSGKIEFVVMGLYGLSAWLKKPRATDDFDILVPIRQVKPTVKLLCGAFPELKPKTTEVVIRLYQHETPVIDVMKPHHPLFAETLKSARWSDVEGHRVRVPSLEMSLALKFFAMVSPHRSQEKSFQDAHDFILLVKNNTKIEMNKLHEYGELAFSGGGAELTGKVEDVRAGRRMEI